MHNISIVMKTDRSYEDFFSSLGVALIICTLIVSIGKLITQYYFCYIIICSLLIIISLMVYDYYKYKRESKQLKKAAEEQYLSVLKLVKSTRKTIKREALTDRRTSSFNGYPANGDIELRLRRRAWMRIRRLCFRRKSFT